MILTPQNTICIIVTFNPEIDFNQTIEKHLTIFDELLIVDNNSENIFLPEGLLKKVTIIKLEKNYGIAKALNVGIEYAISKNFYWVITFDQDSIPVNKILDYYNMAVNKCKDDIFIIGVNYSTNNIQDNYTDINIKETKNIITSGCLYPITIFNKIGFFNEKLFIDGVDFDFNLRVLLNHFKVYKIQEPMIKHNIGAEISKNILFIEIFSSNHNEIRRYYIGRNHVFLTLKYFYRFPFWIFKKNIFFLLSIFKIIIVEDQILLKLKSLFKGLNDGYQFYVENKSGNR